MSEQGAIEISGDGLQLLKIFAENADGNGVRHELLNDQIVILARFDDGAPALAELEAALNESDPNLFIGSFRLLPQPQPLPQHRRQSTPISSPRLYENSLDGSHPPPVPHGTPAL